MTCKEVRFIKYKLKVTQKTAIISVQGIFSTLHRPIWSGRVANKVNTPTNLHKIPSAKSLHTHTQMGTQAHWLHKIQIMLTKKVNSGVTVSGKTSPKFNCNGIHNNALGHLDNVNWFPKNTWNTAPLTFTTKGLVQWTAVFIPQSLNHSLHDNFLVNYFVSTIILNQILHTQFLYICM